VCLYGVYRDNFMGWDSIVGTATRYGWTVWVSNPGGG
jgi:hypothetical protein